MWFRVIISTLDKQRQTKLTQSSGIVSVLLVRNLEARIMDMCTEFQHPIIVSVNLLSVTPESHATETKWNCPSQFGESWPTKNSEINVYWIYSLCHDWQQYLTFFLTNWLTGLYHKMVNMLWPVSCTSRYYDLPFCTKYFVIDWYGLRVSI